MLECHSQDTTIVGSVRNNIVKRGNVEYVIG